MNVWQVLDRAADYIKRHGWVSLHPDFHCRSYTDDNPDCAGNAIQHVCSGAYEVYAPAHEALARALGGKTTQTIYYWNDAPGRTKDEVVAMLRACAMTERVRAARLPPVVRETETA